MAAASERAAAKAKAEAEAREAEKLSELKAALVALGGDPADESPDSPPDPEPGG